MSIFSPPRPFLGEKNMEIKEDKNNIIIEECNVKKTKKLNIYDFPFFPYKFGKKAKRFRKIQRDASYKFVKNDNQPQSLMYLLEAKNLFHFELEKMDEHYITRIVFDPRHETLLILLNGIVIGGICFRLFKNFAEIVFCVIGSKFHTNGFGSYMMTHFKNYLQSINILNIYTYADDTALGFFHRHGFSLHSKLPKKEWAGYLKDYSEATLLSCPIYKNVDYLNIHEVIDNNIRQLEKYLGYSIIHTVNQWPVKIIDGIKIDKHQISKVNENIQAALKKMQMEPKYEMFLRQPPFPDDVLPEKNEMIDFTLLQEKVKLNKYRTFESFSKDLLQIFETCLKYMKNENTYTAAAKELRQAAENVIDTYDIYSNRKG